MEFGFMHIFDIAIQRWHIDADDDVDVLSLP